MSLHDRCKFVLRSADWTNDSILSSTVNSSAADTTLQPNITHNASVLIATTQNASVSPARRPRRSSSSGPLVYSILVEDQRVKLNINY